MAEQYMRSRAEIIWLILEKTLPVKGKTVECISVTASSFMWAYRRNRQV